jgi:uncharacterized iron-regulated membrane protein
MDVTTAREIFAALLVFGATGTASMAVYGLALKSFDIDLLPATTSARVRWWRGHLTPALAISALLLVVGLTGLVMI